MSNKSIFFSILVMLFVAVMTVGMTLIVKDRSNEALEVFSGGAFTAVLCVVFGLSMLDD